MNSFAGALGLRAPIAQHTAAEERLLARCAAGRRSLAEIGVAEGVSAAVLRRAAAPDATVYLIDPYFPGRVPGLNFQKVIAHRHVSRIANARAVWIEKTSFEAAKTWSTPLDFLFIDGDHEYEACLRDWRDWSRFIAEDGLVAFHDARVYAGGPAEDWGPVRVIAELFGPTTVTRWRVVEAVDSLVVVSRQDHR